MDDKIIELLGKGYSHTIVASAVGCDESYISQLLAQDEFRDKVAAIRLSNVHQEMALDQEANSLEEKAMSKLHALLPFVTKPMDALRIYQVANAAKRKAEVRTSGLDNKAPIVQLVLPVNVAVQFKQDTARQVVEINGKSMAALPSAVLNKKLEERRSQLTDSAKAAGLLSRLDKAPAESMSIANIL